MVHPEVEGSPVLELSAPWLKNTPWVWECPDCKEKIFGAEADEVAKKAKVHYALGHK